MVVLLDKGRADHCLLVDQEDVPWTLTMGLDSSAYECEMIVVRYGWWYDIIYVIIITD